jgi:predicted GH43/DUF377 family glycosyl hydrolase
MEIECLLNPGAFQFENKIWLLLRVAERPVQEPGKISFPVFNNEGAVEVMSFNAEEQEVDATDALISKYKGTDYLTTLSHLSLVCSDDGEKFYEPEGFKPIIGEGILESFGIEDCRVATRSDGFHLTYTMVSPYAVGVGYIFTKDWKTFERKGMIFPPHNKDCALFEEKINGKYYALHRPSSPELGGNYIWIAESPDGLHWGNHKLLATTRNGMWDSARLGAGASPIRTEKGWLEIYHGATEEHRYCLGLLLLDSDDPTKVIARSQKPIMEPFTKYEQEGFFGNVVFTNGHIIKGDTVSVYYGASDEVICKADFSISELLKSLGA